MSMYEAAEKAARKGRDYENYVAVHLVDGVVTCCAWRWGIYTTSTGLSVEKYAIVWVIELRDGIGATYVVRPTTPDDWEWAAAYIWSVAVAL